MAEDALAVLPGEAASVLKFWFDDVQPEQWWKQDDQVDKTVREQFSILHEKLASTVPADWLETARGRLAAVIVLDQFPRNLFRGSPKAFESDAKALALAEDAVNLGFDKALTKDERVFLYLPFEHSEDAQAQARSIALFEELGDQGYLDFARKHKLVLDRFGRFPHRNAVLGRKTTDDEREFLEQESWFW
ncbi:MAG: DUF924 domain-containing protein [Hyphomicrobiales bacterium]|nr:DUF924 domain-containing protein [Hyphomicrobiales bacterium]